MSDTIAVVGMACRYPGANNPQQLWENVLTRRRCFRRIPTERINLDDYLADKNDTGDSFYISEAAVLEGYQFDRVKYRIAGKTYRSVDLTHWLALDVAANALSDAGFGDGKGLPRKTTGVLIGNTLTGEFSRAALLRIRWPYVRRIFDARLDAMGWSSEQRQAFFVTTENDFKAPFEPVNEETLAGGLANTIAGRICNYFDLAGGGYTLDGACSSSLLAITNACNALTSGDLDIAITGGVDLSLDPFELIGFSKVTALAEHEMHVYDQRAQGFLPGEGCGMLVLMRHQDALQQGLRCYATIEGWGISSDGGGGITRPEIEGQRLAIQRAYKRANYAISTVTLFEGHGTGTKVGDTVELSALSDELNSDNTSDTAYISSIKSNIGHTKAAAGTAGFIKAVMALQTQLIPPATGFSIPNPVLESPDCQLKVSAKTHSWPEEKPLRSGLSSFGFGGINVHLTLQRDATATTNKKSPTQEEFKQIRSYQDVELFLFSATSKSELQQSIQQIVNYTHLLSYAELIDLAAELTNRVDSNHSFRAAVIASSPKQLKTQLKNLLLNLTTQSDLIDGTQFIFIGTGLDKKPRIAFIFPGQAAPVRLTGGLMETRFPLIEKLYQSYDFPNDDSTALAQPAIILSQLAGLQLLDKFGIKAEAVLGHSLGELTALHYSGAMNQTTLLQLTTKRGKIMSQAMPGRMVSIACTENEIKPWLKDEIVIAAYNASDQIILAGQTLAIEHFVADIQHKNFRVTILPIAHAFHSPLMREVSTELHEFLIQQSFSPIQQHCFSTITGKILEDDINIPDLLTQQLTCPVLFGNTAIELLANSDLCIEVGPGHIISGLLTKNDTVPVISMDTSSDSLQGFLSVIASVFVSGESVNIKALFDDRFFRPFDLDWKPQFFTNPCEKAPLAEQVVPTNLIVETDTDSDHIVKINEDQSDLDPLTVVMQLVSERTELPLTSLTAKSRLLIDLHLNSISVTDLMVSASQRLQLKMPAAPLDYSNATLAELAKSLSELKTLNDSEWPVKKTRYPDGVDSWVRAYQVERFKEPLTNTEIDYQGNGQWLLFSNKKHEKIQDLIAELNSWGRLGVLLVIDESFEQADISLVLKASLAALNQKNAVDYFVLLQQQATPIASVIRTLHLEAPHISTVILEIAITHQDLNQCVISELQKTENFSESYYDSDGRRWQPKLMLIPFDKDNLSLPINQNDILLVTGGGKGIAAESALMLAKLSGAKLAILGRSSPETDSELATNLNRFSAEGINYYYVIADVSVSEQVRKAVISVKTKFGTVTAILHGAGVNNPKLLNELTVPDFNTTLAPKVQGLTNLLAHIKVKQLKLLINFGSIIARSGMRGEADYALANAWQTQRVEEFKKDHPQCHCLSIEWSIWSGIGMGERLGRIDALLQAGITPIIPKQGIEILRELICTPSTPVSVIVSGRLGEMATLQLPTQELPFLRFLERTLIYYPGVELIVEADITVDSDPYLADHVFQNEQILPGVIGLESIAQVAMALIEQDHPPIFKQVEFLQPLVVRPNEKIIIRIAALKQSKNKVEVVIRCSKSNYLSNHFKAVCVFGEEKSDPVTVFTKPSLTPPTINPETDLYGDLFFHSGRFVRVNSYHLIDAWQCSAKIGVGNDSTSLWFGRFLPQQLVLGDLGSRDAALHALQVCIPHATVVPVFIEKIQLLDVDCQGPWLLHAQEISHQHNEFIFDLELINQHGQRREVWRGLKLKKIAPKLHPHWFTELLPVYLQRQLEAIKGQRINVALLNDKKLDRKQRGILAIRNSIGMSVDVCYSSVGKPEVKGYQVSVAHCNNLSLAVSAKKTVSCDIEPVTQRNNDFWLAALGVQGINLAEQFMQQSETEHHDAAMTRIWTIYECLKKAGFPLETPLLLQSFAKDGWLVLDAGKYSIASVIINFHGIKEEIAIAVLL